MFDQTVPRARRPFAALNGLVAAVASKQLNL
jgi:hypothetical protein